MSNGGCATPNGNGPASNLLPKLIRNKGYEIMLFVTIQVSARPPPASRRLTHVNNLGIIKTVRAAEPRNYSHQPGIGYSDRKNPQSSASDRRDAPIRSEGLHVRRGPTAND